MTIEIKKGDLVEFTKEFHQHRTIGDEHALYGVAIEDSSLTCVRVETSSGDIVTARHVDAYAWAGWIPPGLEDAYEKHNALFDDDGFYY